MDNKIKSWVETRIIIMNSKSMKYKMKFGFIKLNLL